MLKKKASWLYSMIAIILSASILWGGTYAWFTAQANSNDNIIKSGNLDIDLLWTEDLESGSWINTAKENNEVIFDYALWEPGYTEVRYFKIVNAGDLAFQYGLHIIPNGNGDVTKLADVIDVYYVDEPLNNIAGRSELVNMTPAGVLSDAIKGEVPGKGVLLADEERIVAVALKMQESAGNDYMGLSIGTDFTVQLVATQYSFEKDAFDENYDSESTFPDRELNASATASVTVENGAVAAPVTLSASGVRAEVPAGVKVAEGVEKLTLTVTNKDESDSNVSLKENEDIYALDVHIEGVAADNTIPMQITLKEAAPVGLNLGNLVLYHVENGSTVKMTRVTEFAEDSKHNQFVYDPVTGDIVLNLANFSEVALVADTENAWKGNFDYSWYTNAVAPFDGEAVTEYTIANADQLAAFGAIVGGMNGQTKDSFAGKTVKLVADVNLGDDEEHNRSNIIFYPIGYYNSIGSYKKTSGGSVSSSVSSFEGTFDGNGHTIANFYQNTWEMFGDYNDGYSGTPNHYKDAMGLFGYVLNGTVKNLTVDNFSSDGEYTPTGVIAAYADGNSTFENIAITNCNPRVYNTGNGGIIGIAGDTSAANDDHIILKNITVDNSNKISALWGSWDVACGGLVGMYRGNVDGSGNATGDTIIFENCHVSAQIDVYNDVCANYQYYAYRYAGMIIGSVRHNKNADGKTIPNMTGISATGCTVNYGDWNDYYYCEFEKNTMASYSKDYQFSRVPHSELNFTDSNGNGVVDADERASVTGCKHTHTPEENHQAIYLPFHQLFTGYSWGVSSIGLEELEGIKNITVSIGKEESVEKFKAVEKTDVSNQIAIKASELFSYLEDCGVEVKDDSFHMGISNLDENGTVTAVFNAADKWEDSTITLTGTGRISITAQDYFFCIPTTIKVTVIERQEAEKFATKFTGNFLYRVGNQNTVSLGRLFEAIDGASIGTVSVTVEAVNGTGASGTYSNNEIQFNGTGVVKVTIKDDDTYCLPTELKLEVVDAVNATTATSATANNVVLLNDCGFSSLEVSGGYTLYGNGFTMTCGSDSAALDMGYSFVTLNNGTLDNVQIVCPNFDYAVLYKGNMTESGNRSETTDRTRYFNVKSGVMASGNSRILNSRISGARAAVNVSGGNLLIDNSRIELGAVASLLVGSANSVTLRDVTLVQKPTASTYDSSKTLMGFSVLFVCDADGNTAPVTLEGTLVQNAWVKEDDKQYVPSAGQSIISTVLGKTEYLHDINGDGIKESLNLGFAYMPENAGSPVNKPTITDNRKDKAQIPYSSVDISYGVGKTYVYSYKNTNGTIDSFKTESEYEPNKYSDIITVTYSDTADGLTTGKSFGTGGWVYELNVDLDKASGYKLDFSKLSMTVNNETVTDYKVNGSAKPTSPVAVTAGGVTYTLTATIDGKEYTATYKVTGTETSKESPSKISGPTTAGFGVAKSYGGDWSGAADVLTGVKVKYWSVAENKYVEFDFSKFTVPGNAGKLNDTNNYWEYTHTNNDFTLKVTNTVAIHSGKSVYGMPIRGTDGKLYFTISSTNGYVGSGTTSRAVTMQYEFTDNNGGEKLTFTHTFNISYNKDDQYKYSDFCNGTLTKLESSSSGSGSCVTPDTLVTLADGTQVRVDSLTGTEQLLVWNMETGALDSAPIMFVDNDPVAEYEVIHLYFSDGTDVKVIFEHGFWDYDLNRYVYLDRDAAQYIGHTFAKQNGDELEQVTLTDVVLETELTTAWSPVTADHLCYFVNGMLSMPGGVGGLFNIFDVDAETMTYDYEALARDIETYGLFTYEELNSIVPLSEDMFNAAGGAYLKVSIGKGNLTMDELIGMINRYSKFF